MESGNKQEKWEEKNTPEIITPRLRLRKFLPSDVEAVYRIYSDVETNRYLPWFPASSREDGERILREKYLSFYQRPRGYRYAVCQIEDDFPIGYVHVGDDDSYDLGYGLRREFWGQGIAAEAAEGVINQLRKDGIPYLTATHDVNNPASGRVMEKLGMSYQYSYREQWQPKNISVVFRMYQLNLGKEDGPIYRGYWDRYPEHFIEGPA